MDGIRIRVEKEMARVGITQKIPPTRPQSLDDYFLLNNVGNQSDRALHHSLKYQFSNPYHPHLLALPQNDFASLGTSLLANG